MHSHGVRNSQCSHDPLAEFGEGPQGLEVRGRRRTGEEVRGRKGKDTGKERAENGRGNHTGVTF